MACVSPDRHTVSRSVAHSNCATRRLPRRNLTSHKSDQARASSPASIEHVQADCDDGDPRVPHVPSVPSRWRRCTPCMPWQKTSNKRVRLVPRFVKTLRDLVSYEKWRDISMSDRREVCRRTTGLLSRSIVWSHSMLSSKGQVAMKAALYDSSVHGAKMCHIMILEKGLTLTVITTKECDDLCGIMTNFDGKGVWIEDPLAVLFGITGPHFPKPGG